MNVTRRGFLKLLGAAAAALSAPAVATSALERLAASEPEAVAALTDPLHAHGIEMLSKQFRVLSVTMSAAADSLVDVALVLQSLDEPGLTCELKSHLVDDRTARLLLLDPMDVITLGVGTNDSYIGGPLTGSMLRVEAKAGEVDLGDVSSLTMKHEMPRVQWGDAEWNGLHRLGAKE